MLIFLRRSFGLPSLTLIALSFIFFLFMIKQVKDLYEKHQKSHRMQNYFDFLSQVSNSMSQLEKSSNKSMVAVSRLSALLDKKAILKRGTSKVPP